MGDAENALPPSKKRAAGRELSRDNPGLDDEEEVPEQETGSFKRASDEVLASRRIVKVRRNQTTSTPSSNPFAGIRLITPTEPSATPAGSTDAAPPAGENTVPEDVKDGAEKETEAVKDKENKEPERKIEEPESKIEEPENKTEEPVVEVTEKQGFENKESNVTDEATKTEVDNQNATGDDETENEEKKEESNENVNTSAEGTPLSSFQQLSSSQNAFTGLAGTGFSTSTFSFGSLPKDGSALGTSSGSLFGLKSDQPSFGFGLSTNGTSSHFNKTGASIVSKGEGSSLSSMQEVAVETGEENERVAFSAESVMFEFLDGGWKERGKGELKVNVSKSETERARLLMRARGHYRLILNASIYPDMKFTNMDKKGITFACMNSTGEGKGGLSTFALKFKDASIVEDFRAAVTPHAAVKPATVLKTPENSPKASDE